MPAEAFLDFIAPSILNIAPERAPKFRELTDDATLSITASNAFECNISAGTHIALCTRVIEIMWPTHTGLFQSTPAFFEGNTSAGQVVSPSPAVRTAQKLTDWAVNTAMAAPAPPWPAWAPVSSSGGTTLSALARDLALSAIAFLLLHELGHRKLGHAGHPVDVSIERDADYYATDWILGGVGPDTLEFRKRSLGMSKAFLS